MTTEEAIEYLTRCADGLDPDFDCAVSMAVFALRAQQNGGWISVDERLPKTEGQLILVALPNGDVRKCQWQGHTHELDPWYDVSENVWFADIVVTHWQPLPEPPMERAQELAQAEKDGRLVVLPCKAGNTLYSITCGEIKPFVVAGFEMYDKDLIAVEQIKLGRELRVVGKTAFLTREEAEAALAKANPT